MKIYSDCITENDLDMTIRQVPGMYINWIEEIRRPRVRARGWRLNTAGSTNHFVNSGVYGAGEANSATWDQHGQWFARLYAIDPRARVANYESADDFHAKTKGKYQQGSA